MPGPKKQTPAPIDRPLSRAYLREFGGWSSAYPPGLSDPTSLRIMENVMVNRDGSARIRPGLRYLSYSQLPTEDPLTGDPIPGLPIDVDVRGTHEAFFLNDGTKAYLFAAYDGVNVGFRVLRLDVAGAVVLTLDQAGFAVADATALPFTAATTYVKFLQIDNKIFALSNAGEPMRYFTVGANKTAKTLSAIQRPNWDVADKLTVVHPDAAWVTTGVPTGVRTNMLLNPSAETNVANWTPSSLTELVQSATAGAKVGTKAFRVTSLPSRTNMCPYPVHNSSSTGWARGSNAASWQMLGTYINFTPGGTYGARGYINGPVFPCVAGKTYKAAADWDTTNNKFGIMVRFYNSSGGQIGSDNAYAWSVASGSWFSGRRERSTFTAPSGATQMRIFIFADSNASATEDAGSTSYKNIVVCLSSESSSMFHGGSGTNYFWVGTANASASVYHPPATVQITSSKMSAAALKDYAASIFAKHGGTVQPFWISVLCYNASNTLLATINSTAGNNGVDWNTQLSKVANTPAGTTQVEVRLLSQNTIPRGQYHYFDAGLLEQASAVGTYFDGDTADTTSIIRAWSSTAHGSASTETTYSVGSTIPAAETKTANTLIGTGTNAYNFGFFYVFFNEVGESAASQITVIKAQRGWSQWKWETMNVSGEPSGTATNDPKLAADQLIAYMPQAVFDAAKDQGAVGWNLYMFTWSDQEPVPVVGLKVDSRSMDASSAYGSFGWGRVTPSLNQAADGLVAVPSEDLRYNYSEPSSGGQGIVAADRMVVVNDPNKAAVIKWSSNQQGSYTDFSANKGGGYKTLTSGNLYVPACVKLWQNPQSVDTLTILCMGVDGQSTGYYMAPAAISSQSETTTVMGFEETTATPGTTSPYGCEVMNNALYHPLDEQLMKSTATSYNINHKSQTDQIQNVWERLVEKHHIVSAQHDNRLYYLVHNPDGDDLEPGCWGNEIWVLDASSEGGTWSRWLIQGLALRRIESGGKVYMSVTRPDGIYYLDPDYGRDDFIDQPPASPEIVSSRPIAWKLETNTQGANRAHDAWAHLQRISITLGNFSGTLRYGIRGRDRHGEPVDINKLVRDDQPGTWPPLAYDLDDHLQIRRDMQQWFFYAESVDGEESSGQINLVQYSYTPISVNVGYEYGSVETFDYGRAAAVAADQVTTNGTPVPYIDTSRP